MAIYKGKGIGVYGDVSMFSFHATKVFHTIEGGCLTFKDESLKQKISLERNFGVNGESLECFGTNAKMNEFQAAMGICNLRHIDEEIAKRRRAYERYTDRLSKVKGLTLLSCVEGIKQNYAYYPILVDLKKYGLNRNELCERLALNNIYARKYFYPLVSKNKGFTHRSVEATPKAEYYAENVLCLPLYADLTLAEIDIICDIIQSKLQ